MDCVREGGRKREKEPDPYGKGNGPVTAIISSNQ